MAATAPARTGLRLVTRRPSGPPAQVSLDELAHETGLHPEVIRRLVRLGLLDPVGGSRGAGLFPRDWRTQALGPQPVGALLLLGVVLAESVRDLVGRRAAQAVPAADLRAA